MKVAIASAVRTPVGSFAGALASVPAARLGAAAIKEAVKRAGIESNEVDIVYMGNVLMAGQGQAPGRQAAIHAGLDQATPAVTLNKMCGSGLEAIIQAYRAVALGDAKFAVAGGMESMSNAPYLLPGARNGYRMGDAKAIDSMIHDGLWDAYGDKHMGSCAELCATKYEFTREMQDEFATRSYKRAQAAIKEGRFNDELVPFEITGRKGEVTVVSEDEEPSRVNFDKMAGLRPVFEKSGTITAANASTLNDGASALVLCTEETARERGLNILATISGYDANAHEPEWFTTAPVGAMQKVYKKLGWQPGDVDLYEINEAFSVVAMAAMHEFNLDPERVNINGGAIALGHPIGSSGSRIMVTLLHALKAQNKERGMVGICIGGGEALAMAVERA